MANVARGIIFFILLTLLIGAYYMQKNEPEEETVMHTGPCIHTLSIDQTGALFSQFDSFMNDYELKDTYVGARKSGYVDLDTVKNYTVRSKTIAWVDNKEQRIVLDLQYSKGFVLGDVTGTANEKIGAVTQALMDEWGGRKIATFLLESQIVNTYWHIGSELCLYNETNEGMWYEAYFKGTHTYYTNEANSDPLDFVVRIDKRTGEVFIESK